jgi:hypothetical protein
MWFRWSVVLSAVWLAFGCSEAPPAETGSAAAEAEAGLGSEMVSLPAGVPETAREVLGAWTTNAPATSPLSSGASEDAAASGPSEDAAASAETAPASGDLVIRADGTYEWRARGGMSGAWKAGDKDYPVVLLDTVETKEWRVGIDRGKLVIWDGRIWYEGVR